MADGATGTRRIRLISSDPDETRGLGRRIGTAARAGDVFLLEGDFGSGKTTFVQGLAAGLGVEGEVTSPSFVLVHEHEGRPRLYHVDLYRLERLDDETLELVADAFEAGGVSAVEWPGLLPPELRVAAATIRFLRLDEERRGIEVLSADPRLLAAARGDAAGD